jgi:hypothetical protein
MENEKSMVKQEETKSGSAHFVVATPTNVVSRMEQQRQHIQDLTERLRAADDKAKGLMMENADLKRQIRSLPQNDEARNNVLGANEKVDGGLDEPNGIHHQTISTSKEEEEEVAQNINSDVDETTLDRGVPERTHYDEAWNIHFVDLQRFKAMYGHMRVIKNYSKVLCEWVSRQRRVLSGKKKGIMNQARLDALDRIGFGAMEEDDHDVLQSAQFPEEEDNEEEVDDLDAFAQGVPQKDYLDKQWNVRFLEVREFRLKHGHCRVPPGYSKGLSSWGIYQRQLYNGTKRGNRGETIGMDATRIAALTSLGMDWGDGHKSRKQVDDLDNSPKRRRKSDVAPCSDFDTEPIASKRRESAPVHRLLVKNVDSSDSADYAVHRVNKNTDSSPGSADHRVDEESPGNSQRESACDVRKFALAPAGDQRASCPEPTAEVKTWESNLRRLKRFKAQKGHIRVTVFNDRSLFIWINRQRQLYRGTIKGCIRKDRVDALNAIGFDWQDANGRKEAREPDDGEADTSGHIINQGPVTEENTEAPIEQQSAKDTMHTVETEDIKQEQVSVDQSQELDKGVQEYHPRDRIWNLHFKNLQRYKKKHGSYKVFRTRDSVLNDWVSRQRLVYQGKKQGNLNEERRDALNRIGFANWGKS